MALKDLKKGTPTELKKLSQEEHTTNPPGRFSEVKLVATLESLNIGRPSTFSSIVSLIQDRGYVAKKGNQLYPTPLGFAVARLLNAKLPKFTDYAYTAAMETELDEIAEGKKNRVKFLNSFWGGKDGFEKLLETLTKNIDFKEIEQFARVDLYNGFSVKFSRFGTFLQDDQGKPNAEGYLPSVRIDDDSDVWDYRDPDFCRETFEKAANRVDARELGILSAGEYAGWTVWARDGKFGPYVQALHPDHVKAVAAGKKPAGSVPKPINHGLAEEFEVATVQLSEISPLFAEIKLPRTLSEQIFVGIGKRGPWIGWKVSAKARRATFISMPEEFNPRTITAEEAQKVWDDKRASKKEAEDKKAARAAAPKKPTAKKPVPKKPAAKKPPVKKPASKK